MKRRFFEKFSLLAFVLMSAIFFSCEKEEPQVVAEPKIEIKIKSTSSTGAEFELQCENAENYFYRVGEKSGNQKSKYISGNIEDNNPVVLKVDKLVAETEYVIEAYSVGGTGLKSEVEKVEFVTNGLPSIQVSIVETGFDKVKFKLSPVNASLCRYAVVADEKDIETAELVNEVEVSSEQEFEVSDLEDGMKYYVVAQAENTQAEVSERVSKVFKTETEPVVTVSGIEPGYNNAVVKFKADRKYVSKIAYAVVEGKSEEPKKDDFKIVDVQVTETTVVYIYDLLEKTEYSVYAYGINDNGDSGNTVVEKFVTTEYVRMPFEIKVSNITSTDADWEIYFDKSVYSKVYFVGGPVSAIGNKDDWNWGRKIEEGWSYPQYKIYEESSNFTLREWLSNMMFEVAAEYIVGGIPVKTDGMLDEENKIWVSFKMLNPEYGKSSVECVLTEKNVALTTFKFIADMKNAAEGDVLFVNNVQGEFIDQNIIEEVVAKSVLSNRSFKNWGSDTTLVYLSPGTKYTLFAVPRDSQGNLGKIVTLTYETLPSSYEGDAECSAEIMSHNQTSVQFNCSKGKSAEKILYSYTSYNQWYNEDNFITSLKISNYEVPENGELEIEYLYEEEEYMFGFVALDENGLPGKPVLIRHKTIGYSFDGDQNASVITNITSCNPTEFGGYYVKIHTEPNENVSKYYVAIVDETSKMTDSQFAGKCLRGSETEYTGAADIEGYGGTGLYAAQNSYLWVLAIDNQGKLVPIVKTKIEGTWE